MATSVPERPMLMPMWARMMAEPHFANARSVRNELELARLRHAHRLSSDVHREWTRDDLMRFEPEDLLISEA